jgi:hypothetical protein
VGWGVIYLRGDRSWGYTVFDGEGGGYTVHPGVPFEWVFPDLGPEPTLPFVALVLGALITLTAGLAILRQRRA